LKFTTVKILHTGQVKPYCIKLHSCIMATLSVLQRTGFHQSSATNVKTFNSLSKVQTVFSF